MTQCGDGRPGSRPLRSITKMEKLRRVDFAADVLITFQRSSQQIEAVRLEFGIGRRQALRYLAEARERVIEATRKSQNHHLADAIEFYESVYLNPLQPINARLKARNLLDRAVGVGFGPTSAGPVGDPLAGLDLAAIARAAREERRVAVPPPPEPEATPVAHVEGGGE